MHVYLLISLMVLSGCAFVGYTTSGNYPDDWPAIVPESDGCPDIAGVYESIGRSGYVYTFFDPHKNDKFPSLTKRLLRDNRLRISAVQMSQPDPISFVVAATNLSAIYDADLPEGNISVPVSRTYYLGNDDFRCEKGMLWVHLFEGDKWWAQKTGFRKAADGSLVGKEIRIYDADRKSTTYYLWPPFVQDATAAEK